MLSFLNTVCPYLLGFNFCSLLRISFKFICFALAAFIKFLTSLITADMMSVCASLLATKKLGGQKLLTELSLVVFVLVVHVLQGGETEVNQLDCLVNVLLLNKVSELELGHGLGNSDDGK